MKKLPSLFGLILSGSVPYVCSAETMSYLSMLPAPMVARVATDSEMTAGDVRFFPGGTVKVGGIYVSAISFVDSVKNCSIYVLSSDKAYSLFNGTPCEFSSKPAASFARGSNFPDLLFKIKLFSPSQGAMADELVAFYYDKGKSTYCESLLLSDWYVDGNKSVKPDLSDGRCLAEGQ